ncbi:UNVERIFIED_CONTAM: putative ribonuclease H protein [Sesamum latifolium]|uniref:Ribonuclease H protein n=1 Tax=Sesamum latifolium TaxID=2727402 RepID=A0AAW2XJI0_9LAMI
MPRAPLPKLIPWVPPNRKWWKLNCDGASKGNRGLAGAGGLARDCQGNLIFAFYDCLDVQTNTYAELFAVVRGLQLARERGCRQIWVETDAMAVLHLIQKDEGDWHIQMLLTRLIVMRRGMNLLFTHVYREGNQPADFLANKACEEANSAILSSVQGHLATLI